MRKTAQVVDRSRLRLLSLGDRAHDLDIGVIKPLKAAGCTNDSLRTVASRIVKAKANGSEIILMMGGHVLRSGVQNYLIDLMERGYITCMAMNGSCIIHDFELAMIGI